VKIKVFIVALAVFWVVMFIAFAASKLNADDVYNFYFQKAPGPVTVNQGGGSPATPLTSPLPGSQALVSTTPVAGSSPVSASPAPTPVADQTPSNSGALKTEVEKQKTNEVEFRHWQLTFGRASFTSAPGEFSGAANTQTGESVPSQSVINGQWALGAEYKFSRYFSLQANILLIQDRQIGLSNMDYGGGIAVTPFHVDLFGWSFLNISFLGGYMSVPTTDYSYSENFNYPNGMDVTGYDVAHNGSYYVGLGAEIPLGKSVSILGEAKIMPEFRITQTSLLLGFNL